MNIAIQGREVSCEILGHLFTWTHTLKFFLCHHALLGDLRAFWVSSHYYFLLIVSADEQYLHILLVAC